MRKVVSGLFISVDGVVESPDKWQFDNFDEGMGQAMGAFIAATDTLLLGRKTYEEWAGYWPTSDDDTYGPHINNTPKYVVSTTLDDVAWGSFDNIHLIKGSLAEELSKLKQQPGKNISTTGSPTLVRSMLNEGLLDELILMIHPVVVGSGKRLFQEGDTMQRLKLADSAITPTGVAILTYRDAQPV